MKSLVSSREWKRVLLHGGSLPAQSGNWAASLVVSALETCFLKGSIAQALGYRLCYLKAGTCEILVLPLILERSSDGSSQEKRDGVV